jgi:hypothetical protein
MADAYRAKIDTSIPKAIRQVDEGIDGQAIYETVGRTYDAGQVVLAEDITPPLREKAENVDLDHLLEPISLDDALAELNATSVSVFIPEHEAEAVALADAGHTVVPKDQELELKSAGANAAKTAQEDLKEDDADARPNLTAPVTPSLAEVEQGADNVPEDSEHVPDEALVGVEAPPGVPVGQALAEASGEDVASERKPRSRPARQRRQSASEKPEGEG